MRKRNLRKNLNGTGAKAFTLIELLVVIVVIAVLAAIIIPKFTDQSARSKQAASDANMQTIRKALAAFSADTGLMPLNLNVLTATTPPPNGADPVTGATKPLSPSAWHGPYMQNAIPVDPVTGCAYFYSLTAGSVGQIIAVTTVDADVADGGVTGGGDAGGATRE